MLGLCGIERLRHLTPRRNVNKATHASMGCMGSMGANSIVRLTTGIIASRLMADSSKTDL
jgi:hypothetical protein